MKKLTLMLALAPALALAAQQQGAQQRGQDGDTPARQEQVQKRMRLARTLGLAEALDLDEAGALKMRDLIAKYDDRRTPLRKQVRDAVRTLRDAAQGAPPRATRRPLATWTPPSRTCAAPARSSRASTRSSSSR